MKSKYLYSSFLVQYISTVNSFTGNVLLPPMGFCEIHESSKDVKQSITNSNKFVCEISPNILYQYVLILLWFLIVFSIIVSISGFLVNLVGHIVTVTCFLRHDNPAREIYQNITFRECEYLEMIRRHNIPAFGEIVRRLQVSRNIKTNAHFDSPETTPLALETKTNGSIGNGGVGNGTIGNGGLGNLYVVKPNAPLDEPCL